MKELEKYRNNVLTHLEYIKEKVDANHTHLQLLNGRVRENEKQISWMKGIGAAITFVLSVGMSIIVFFKE
jgi:hypothetical protein